MYFPSHSYLYSTPIETSEVSGQTPCFVLTVLGRYPLLQWSRRNQTAKYHSRTSLVTLFSKVSSDMSNLEMMPSPGGIITDVNRAAEDSFTQKTAN